MTGNVLSRTLFLAGSLLCFFAAGCTPHRPDSGFLENPALMKPDKRLPFNAFWIAPGIDLRAYSKVYVAPVDTSHLIKMDWWDRFSMASASASANPEAESRYLANTWHDELVRGFRESKNPHYEVTDSPDENTLVIELAIVEVVPTKVWLNTLSYIVAGGVDNGLTAIEGRMRAGPQGDIVALLKDAKTGQFSLVSVADMTWYSHCKHTLDHWSSQIVELCSSAPDTHIAAATPITLRPW